MRGDSPVKRQLVENLRFYGDVRFKQLTLLMAGMTMAGAGIARDSGSAVVGTTTMRELVALFALLFVVVMWIMEVRAVGYWVANREQVRDLWPRPSVRLLGWVNSTNALLLLHIVLYSGWSWLVCEWMCSWWLVIGLGLVGAFLFVFSCCSYWPMWSRGKSAGGLRREEVYVQREWIPITLTGDEVAVGVSGKMREWCIDIDNRGNKAATHIVCVRAYEGDELLDEKKVNPDGLVRVCLEAAELRLYIDSRKHRLKYAFA